MIFHIRSFPISFIYSFFDSTDTACDYGTLIMLGFEIYKQFLLLC